MLILTRRIGESLQIGEDIKLMVLSVRGNQVQIGIEAPPEVAVHREEVYERLKREQRDNGSGEANLSFANKKKG